MRVVYCYMHRSDNDDDDDVVVVSSDEEDDGDDEGGVRFHVPKKNEGDALSYAFDVVDGILDTSKKMKRIRLADNVTVAGENDRVIYVATVAVTLWRTMRRLLTRQTAIMMRLPLCWT